MQPNYQHGHSTSSHGPEGCWFLEDIICGDGDSDKDRCGFHVFHPCERHVQQTFHGRREGRTHMKQAALRQRWRQGFPEVSQHETVYGTTRPPVHVIPHQYNARGVKSAKSGQWMLRSAQQWKIKTSSSCSSKKTFSWLPLFQKAQAWGRDVSLFRPLMFDNFEDDWHDWRSFFPNVGLWNLVICLEGSLPERQPFV